ncbi:MAG: hypothetical protein ACXVBF_11220, partial [Flavisolibacter sp.]
MEKSEQFLYELADSCAKIYVDKINVLRVYLVFILEFSQKINTRPAHLVMIFLDILLQNIKVSAFSIWRQLDIYVRSQRISNEALQQWNLYIANLGLS